MCWDARTAWQRASCPFKTSEFLTEVGFNRINQLLAIFQRPRNRTMLSVRCYQIGGADALDVEIYYGRYWESAIPHLRF